MINIEQLMEVATEITQKQRQGRFEKSKQLSLGEIIEKLETILLDKDNTDNYVIYDFCGFYPDYLHSWRGSYNELSLNYSNRCSSEGETLMKGIDFLKMLKGAIGKSFEGWKGGDFTMHENSPVWVSRPNYSGNTAVVDIVKGEYGAIVLVTGYMEY